MIETAPRDGGKLCDPKDLAEVTDCNTEPCQDPIDCVIGDWSEWDACSCSCNGEFFVTFFQPDDNPSSLMTTLSSTSVNPLSRLDLRC